jgi:hypothetical protein
MFPDFLCIGAQKSGTSWLYHNIRYHPQIWLPPVKELHYFDHPHWAPYVFQMLTSQPHGRRARKAAKRLLDSLHDRNTWQWYYHYLFSLRNPSWYRDLFRPDSGQVCGEITPNYADLDPKMVAQIHTLMPNLKVIYLLRNPIDRLWSATAMFFARQGYASLDEVESSNILKYLNHKGPQTSSDYLRTLEIWYKYYPTDQIFIGFYEQVKQDPKSLLQNIYRFLSIDDSDQYIPETISERRNARSYPGMSKEIKSFLAQRYYGQVQKLHQMFVNEYTEQWLQSVKNSSQTNF